MENPCTILLADDEPEYVLLVERAFQVLDTTRKLAVVTDGEEAVSYLTGVGKYADRAQFPFPSLLLLDLTMPRRNGLEVLVWIRQQPNFRHLPVIVLTTSAFSSDVRTAYLLGANSFLTKPKDVAGLADAIRRTCDYWLGPLPAVVGVAQQPPPLASA